MRMLLILPSRFLHCSSHLHTCYPQEKQKPCFKLTGSKLLFPFHFEFKYKDLFSANSWTVTTLRKGDMLRIISSLGPKDYFNQKNSTEAPTKKTPNKQQKQQTNKNKQRNKTPTKQTNGYRFLSSLSLCAPCIPGIRESAIYRQRAPDPARLLRLFPGFWYQHPEEPIVDFACLPMSFEQILCVWYMIQALSYF